MTQLGDSSERSLSRDRAIAPGDLSACAGSGARWVAVAVSPASGGAVTSLLARDLFAAGRTSVTLVELAERALLAQRKGRAP